MNTNLALGFLYSGDIWDEDIPYELHDVGYEMLAELKGKDLAEVKHGEWKTDKKETVVRYGDEYEVHIPYCSECG